MYFGRSPLTQNRCRAYPGVVKNWYHAPTVLLVLAVGCGTPMEGSAPSQDGSISLDGLIADGTSSTDASLDVQEVDVLADGETAEAVADADADGDGAWGDILKDANGATSDLGDVAQTSDAADAVTSSDAGSDTTADTVDTWPELPLPDTQPPDTGGQDATADAPDPSGELPHTDTQQPDTMTDVAETSDHDVTGSFDTGDLGPDQTPWLDSGDSGVVSDLGPGPDAPMAADNGTSDDGGLSADSGTAQDVGPVEVDTADDANATEDTTDSAGGTDTSGDATEPPETADSFGGTDSGGLDTQDASVASDSLDTNEDVGPLPIESFTMDGAFDAGPGPNADLAGHEPVASGTYPVFIWLTGTTMSWWTEDDQAYTQEMAQRGFVAASIDYPNKFYPTSCGALTDKAALLFGENDPSVALSQICARPKADCSKGIVTAGFSQGAHLAALAANFDSRVAASFLIGHGTQATDTNDLSGCLAAATIDLPTDRIRSIVGDADGYFGCDPDGLTCDRPGIRTQQELVTGVSCGPGAFDCLAADGSGFYIVQASETDDGEAPHCFTYTGLCGPDFDLNYANPTGPWSLEPSLDWLASFAAP